MLNIIMVFDTNIIISKCLKFKPKLRRFRETGSSLLRLKGFRGYQICLKNPTSSQYTDTGPTCRYAIH